MKLISRILLLATLCSVIYVLVSFNALELSFLKKHYSWTVSKSLPYIMLGLGGLLMAFFCAKSFKFKSRIITAIIHTILVVSPFAIGFAMHPIYEGDFSSKGTEIDSSEVVVNGKYDLMVITIPGCPFCLESIKKLKLIKELNPEISILFAVCAKDEKDMSLYKEEVNGAFDVKLAEDAEQSMKLARGHFPSFVHLEDGKPEYLWSNSQFGAGAIDELLSEL